jgi:hypothetical protein
MEDDSRGGSDPFPADRPKGKKKARLGFKEDRYKKYKLSFDKTARRKALEQQKKGPVRVKEVRFDSKAREEWLTTRHKEKNMRRAKAYSDSKAKKDRESSKLRKELREEARQQYNAYAKVPILPDFSYHIPKYVDGLGRPVKERGDAEGDEEEGEGDEKPEDPVLEESTFYGDATAAEDGEGVRVEVQPLFARSTAKTTGPVAPSRRGGGLDFSDLPPKVAAELQALHEQQQRGASQQKRKLHVMKTMQKIMKIQKHSKKGHGKKGKSGKKKNRK